MQNLRRHLVSTVIAAVGALFATGVCVAATDITPSDWLTRMAGAVQTTNYEGTVIRMRNGKTELLKVVHVVTRK